MIVATLIASIESAKVHCEWHNHNYASYQHTREKIKKFINDKSFEGKDFEIATLKDNFILQFVNKLFKREISYLYHDIQPELS